MFVQIHVLKDYSAALPNRDLSGLAKRMPYGDALRQRISSQCIKAALRSPDAVLFRTGPDGSLAEDTLPRLGADLGLGISWRSRLIFPRLVLPRVAERIGDRTLAGAYVDAVAGLFARSPKGAEDEDADPEADDGAAGTDPAEPGRLRQPIVLGEAEIDAIAATTAELARHRVDPKLFADLLLKERGLRKLPQAVQDAVERMRAMRRHCGLDGALFGRMATNEMVSNVEGCVAVAHALTVHGIQSQPDYFSVRDMLNRDDEAGASHTNTTELTSGLFYSYAVVDLGGLARNLVGLDARQRAGIVGWLVRAFHSVEPASKRGSTAPFGTVHEMVVEMGRRQPRSLMGAFQKAIVPLARSELSLSERAVAVLGDYRARMGTLAGAPERSWTLTASAAGPLPAFEALAAEVEAAVAAQGPARAGASAERAA